MQKKIFITVILVFMLCSNVYGNVDLIIKGMDADDLNTTVSYNIYNNGDHSCNYKYITEVYTCDNLLLDSKEEILEMLPNSMAIRNVSFDNIGANYAKVYATAEDNSSIIAINKINADEKRVVEYNFQDEKFQSLGNLTQSRTVDGLTFNYSNKAITLNAKGFVNLYGGGNISNCSLTFVPDGKCHIKIIAESTDAEKPRTMRIVNKHGALVKDFTVSNKDIYEFDYIGTQQDLTLFSLSSGLNIYSIQLYYHSIPTDYSTVYVNSWKDLNNTANNSNTQNIYVAGGTIKCDSQMLLSKKNADLTITGADNTATIFDFSDFATDFVDTPKENSLRAINVTGSGYTLKNFIIESVPGKGISLQGENCCNNLVENVVTRYNYGSGLFISAGAHDNIIRQCDSYRNCDIYTKGQDADGFSFSVKAGKNNIADNCRSFDNGDDGYDNFANQNDFYYYDCYCWNNGNIDVFTGKYDYDRGLPVDRKLGLVKFLSQNSEEFRNGLENNELILPRGLLLEVRSKDLESTVPAFFGDYITTLWEGNGNGFKLGSGDSAHGPQTGSGSYRLLHNCIAFDHNNKGFDRNHATSVMNLKNIFCFNNYKNYWSDGITLENAENIQGYKGKVKDTMDSDFPVQNLTYSQGQKKADYVYAKAAELIDMLNNDIIPGRFIINPDLPLYGDADADGILTAADSAEILQKVLNNSYILPLQNVNAEYSHYIDVDCDNVLTANDATWVLQKVLNNILLPIEQN